jgi:hypothetical protein
MFESVDDDVVSYERKKQKVGMLVISLIKEAWNLILPSTIHVESNLLMAVRAIFVNV